MKKLTIVLLVLTLCIGCDQITKYAAKEFLPPYLIINVIGDAVQLQYVENKGTFLSLGASLSEEVRFWLFTVIVSLILVGLFVYLIGSRSLDRSSVIAISLILGGGIGNIIDRVIYGGAVIDFLNLGIGGLRTGIFNMADVAITAGTLLLLWSKADKDWSRNAPSYFR